MSAKTCPARLRPCRRKLSRHLRSTRTNAHFKLCNQVANCEATLGWTWHLLDQPQTTPGLQCFLLDTFLYSQRRSNLWCNATDKHWQTTWGHNWLARRSPPNKFKQNLTFSDSTPQSKDGCRLVCSCLCSATISGRSGKMQTTASVDATSPPWWLQET